MPKDMRSPSTLKHCFSSFFSSFHNFKSDNSSLGSNAFDSSQSDFKNIKEQGNINVLLSSKRPVYLCHNFMIATVKVKLKRSDDLSHVEQCESWKKMGKAHSDCQVLSKEENVCKPYFSTLAVNAAAFTVNWPHIQWKWMNELKTLHELIQSFISLLVQS